MTKDEILTRLLEDLGKRYPIGLYEWLYKHRPEAYKQLLVLEDRIDHIVLDQRATVEDLKAVLREYWTFHMGAIRDFKSTLVPLSILQKDRKQLEEQRIKA